MIKCMHLVARSTARRLGYPKDERSDVQNLINKLTGYVLGCTGGHLSMSDPEDVQWHGTWWEAVSADKGQNMLIRLHNSEHYLVGSGYPECVYLSMRKCSLLVDEKIDCYLGEDSHWLLDRISPDEPALVRMIPQAAPANVLCGNPQGPKIWKAHAAGKDGVWKMSKILSRASLKKMKWRCVDMLAWSHKI